MALSDGPGPLLLLFSPSPSLLPFLFFLLLCPPLLLPFSFYSPPLFLSFNTFSFFFSDQHKTPKKRRFSDERGIHTETQSSHFHLLITIAPHTYTHIYDFLAMIFVVVGGVFIYREVTDAIYIIWLSS